MIRGFRAIASVAAAALLAAGCAGCAGDAATFDGPMTVQEDGTVQASRVVGGIRLVNGTGRGVAYAVVNRGWLGLIGPCATPTPDCVRLAPGATVVVPDAEIMGRDATMTEVVVYWWHVERPLDEWRASEVKDVVVPM